MGKNIIECIFVLLLNGLVMNAQSSAEINAYIQKYSSIALSQERESGVPASITLAQGILESGAGTSELTLHSNNHFGIKAGSKWEGRICHAWDDEPVKSKFRAYNSAEESFKDHSLLLKNSPRYSSLFQKSIYDYRAWAIGLQLAGYASAPGYAKALIGYIETYKLYEINGGVKMKPGKRVIITESIENTSVENQENENETESSEEEKEINRIISRYVVEINDVRCTLLYPGQTLSTLAQHYNVSKEKLLKYNDLISERDIHEGDIVFLQSKNRQNKGMQEYYRVKEGDSLHSVSQMFGIKLSSLAKMNNKNPYTPIRAGEKLRLKQ